MNTEKRSGIHSKVPQHWLPHEDPCSTCILREAKSKGGRPSKTKGKTGRPKTIQSSSVTTWSTELLNTAFLRSPSDYTSPSLADLHITMQENAHIENYICNLCFDLLKRPIVVSKCEHVFCGLCLINYLRENSNPVCPTCKVLIPPMEESIRPGIMLNRLLQSVYVKCNCGIQISLKYGQEHQCSKHKVLTTGDILNLSPSKPVPRDVEECVTHIVGIKMKQSSLPNKTIQLPTGSSRVKYKQLLLSFHLCFGSLILRRANLTNRVVSLLFNAV